MEKEVLGQEYDTVISSYYGDDVVVAVITVKVDTKEADKLAADMTEFDCIEDVFLVTGDTDIVAKARFNTYRDLKDFVVGNLGKLSGVKETKTLMVVTTYKERGIKKEV
jgi:Lrp/AsnC family leucine-responsive transcriptional regulator